MEAQSLVDRLPFVGTARVRLEEAARRLLEPPSGMPRVDFEHPAGDPGVLGPDSVGWRIFANPGTMFIGGVAAVFLELAEPRVRSGVWDYTEFRTDPVGRMRRTGIAAMITTYGARADVEAVTARVRAMHARVRGVTPDGVPYRADDPELVTWVHVTAVYGFLNAYLRYLDPGLSRADQDRCYRESIPVARLYGAEWAPGSVDEVEEYMESARPRLVDHPIVHEFQELVSNAPTLSAAAQPLQRLLVQAAIDVLPDWARRTLNLERGQWFRVASRPVVSGAVAVLGRLVPDGPPQQACRRMGLSASTLS
jgi:uncharacterized protein (DUF2236 family)